MNGETNKSKIWGHPLKLKVWNITKKVNMTFLQRGHVYIERENFKNNKNLLFMKVFYPIIIFCKGRIFKIDDGEQTCSTIIIRIVYGERRRHTCILKSYKWYWCAPKAKHNSLSCLDVGNKRTKRNWKLKSRVMWIIFCFSHSTKWEVNLCIASDSITIEYNYYHGIYL